MRRRTKRLLFILAALIFLSALLFVFWQQDILRPAFKRWATRHIILVQRVRKFSNVFFWPQAAFGRNQLETYSLEIKPADWQKLNDNLPKGSFYDLEASGQVFGAISGENKLFVPAKFIYQGQSYDAKVRYRGESYDHWYYPKKSWLVNFKKGASPFGIDKINLIIPSDRSYLGEELNYYRAKKFGLIAPESGFVNLAVNGQNHGVYWRVEDWSARILERNNRSASGCIFGARLVDISRDNLWRDPAFDEAGNWKEYTNNACQAEGFSRLNKLLGLLSANQTVFDDNIGQFLSVERVLAWDALGRLAGSKHGQGYNLRLYYDSQTKKFEFIPWDFGIRELSAAYLDGFYNDIISRLLYQDKHYNRRNRILWDYVRSQANLEDDLRWYDELLSRTRTAFYRDDLKNDSNFEFRKRVGESRAFIADNFNKIKNNLAAESDTFVYLAAEAGQFLLTVSTFSPAPLALEKLACQNNCPPFAFYFDVNNNNRRDPEDRQLPIANEEGSVRLREEIAVQAGRLLLTVENAVEKWQPGRNNFIIMPLSGDVKINAVVLRQALTGQELSPPLTLLTEPL